MIRYGLLIVCMMLPLGVFSQQQAAYNQKGDEAMKRSDYRDAQMWYEEGVLYCDAYSIDQLTAIWLQHDDMRPAMRSLMTKCFNCLTVHANENDTTAISQLITYYKEGIGIPRNDELVVHWTQRLESYRNPTPVYPDQYVVPAEPHTPMKWFAGYAFSLESPFGITIGGMWERIGWYARVKTNFSFIDHAYECDNYSNVFPLPVKKSTRYNTQKGQKTNSFAGLGGVVVRMNTWLYGSVGLGYGVRDVLCPFVLTDYDNPTNQTEVWCYNMDASYKGVSAECDLMVRLGDFFVSGGANTINFKYVDLNAGVGYFF